MMKTYRIDIFCDGRFYATMRLKYPPPLGIQRARVDTRSNKPIPVAGA